MKIATAFLPVFLAVAGLSGCAPPAPKQALDDEAAMRAEGYASAPRITSVSAGAPGRVMLGGEAQPGSRVRVQYGAGGGQAIGSTADSKGRYRVDLPTTPVGGLYDVSTVENGGREMHADGRLFVPPDVQDRAVLLRTGAPSLSIGGPQAPLSVVDFDGAGALIISGRVAPATEVEVSVDGGPPATVQSGPDGIYHVKGQVSSPERGAQIVLNVHAGSTDVGRTLLFTVPDADRGDQMSRVDGGWRVDWVLPGGGMQSAIVY